MTAAKESPDAHALRAQPRPVKRLSRRTLAMLLGVSALAIAGASVWALRTGERAPPPSEPVYSTERKATAEGLAALPQDYAEAPSPDAAVPQLGPPLPGDLGGPILEAQREGRIASAPGAADPAVDAAAERQRRLKAQEDAIVSPLLALARQDTATAQTPPAPGVEPGAAVPATSGAGEDRRRAFLGAPADGQTVSAARLLPPPSPYAVMAGTVIAAALVTGLNSDLPGLVVATVTEPVHDSVTGKTLLIPQGARLLGTYDSQVGFGEDRALVIWTRLILPDGASIVLDRLPATDAQGYAGVADKVDHHWRRLAAGAALSTLLGAGAELAAPDMGGDGDRVIIAGRGGLQGSVNQAGQEVTRRNLNIKPTITVRPGTPLRVLVGRDLVMSPYAPR